MCNYKDAKYLKEEYLIKRRSIASIAVDCGISAKLMYYYLKKFNLNTKGTTSNVTIDEDMFDWSDHYFSYMAGLIVTDGYLDYTNNRISIRVSNDGSNEVLTTIGKHFMFTGEVNVYKEKNNDLTFRSRRVFEVLKQADIFGCKDNRYFNPSYIAKLPLKSQIFFMRGILDGDGNIHNNIFRIGMKSEIFIISLISYLNIKFGFNYKLKFGSNSTKKHYYPLLEMRKADSKIFLDFIYSYPRSKLKFLDKYNKYMSIG